MTGILRIWEAPQKSKQLSFAQEVRMLCVCRVFLIQGESIEQTSIAFCMSVYINTFIEYWQTKIPILSVSNIYHSGSIPTLVDTRLLLMRHIFGHAFAEVATTTCATSIEKLMQPEVEIWQKQQQNLISTDAMVSGFHEIIFETPFFCKALFIWAFNLDVFQFISIPKSYSDFQKSILGSQDLLRRYLNVLGMSSSHAGFWHTSWLVNVPCLTSSLPVHYKGLRSTPPNLPQKSQRQMLLKKKNISENWNMVVGIFLRSVFLFCFGASNWRTIFPNIPPLDHVGIPQLYATICYYYSPTQGFQGKK